MADFIGVTGLRFNYEIILARLQLKPGQNEMR